MISFAAGVVLATVGVLLVGYLLGKYKGKNAVLSVVAAHIDSLEASAALDVRKLGADLKSEWAKIKAKL